MKVENEIDKQPGGALCSLPLVAPWASYSLGELAESVHHFESKIFIQLTAGTGRNLNSDNPVSASATPSFWRPNVTCRELTTKEVEEIVKAFGRAAEILTTMGVDGIELNAMRDIYSMNSQLQYGIKEQTNMEET